MDLIITVVICITVCICTRMLTKSHITITHTQQDMPSDVAFITEEDVDKAYEDMDKEDVPTFENVIKAINEEFGGIDYAE